MPKENKKRIRRVRNLIIICALTAIVLSVSTYAWFIGMQTVNVNSFDVKIAATNSLLLSLNGEDWSTEVDISESTLNNVSYAGHTNNWGGPGLIPMSSVGNMDATVSRMKLFEKASLATTKGGWRLLASRVANYTGTYYTTNAIEQDGYVVFDLFVRNFSGNQYIADLDLLDEEDIYLTTDSTVKVSAAGVANTGIENSVRVAFTQIGRVSGVVTDPDVITGITCSSDATNGVTGICRNAQIWEPNDTAHVNNAISWYTTSCLKRTGSVVTNDSSYSGNCYAVENGKSYPTYAVTDDIAHDDNIDIYDGASYNSYTKSSLLYSYPYFTDTMKNLTGTNRPTFMKLAPNSITKLRIYIYLEGQDVDNYDYASIGKQITVNFGFTKERYVESDINYNGPTLTPGFLTSGYLG